MVENRLGVISVREVETRINDRAVKYIDGIRLAYLSIGEGRIHGTVRQGISKEMFVEIGGQ